MATKRWIFSVAALGDTVEEAEVRLCGVLDAHNQIEGEGGKLLGVLGEGHEG